MITDRCTNFYTSFFRHSILTGLLLLCGTSVLMSQSSINSVKKKAEVFFQQGDFDSAVAMYKQSGVQNDPDKDIRLRFAISLYETNDLQTALASLQKLDNEGKTDPDVYFYLARTYESLYDFSDAIQNYKKYLQRTKQDDKKRPWIKDQLMRCANGLRLQHGDALAYVENVGGLLNSPQREYGVRNSPTTLGKIYFNSDQKILAHNKTISGNIDIFTSTLTNGKWSIPTLLPAHINTPADEEVYGFSTNGQILYYVENKNGARQIKTDTFSTEPNKHFNGNFTSPSNPHAELGEIVFFNDSICLFSSDQPGGYGGYDLYISFLEKNKWTTGINLGPVINSFYNERYAFLTRNGLTLFYSSDNLQSVGGYDIFSTHFDPEKKIWSTPVNLGFPINSAGDETYIDVAPDGMTAFLTSNRKEGMGKDDLYRILFKEPIQAHQEISAVPTFQQFLQAEEIQRHASASADPGIIKKEYYVSHLFFENASDILTPQNIKKLDLLITMMQIYPKIRCELSCFELPTGQQTYNVYYSIKKSEEVAQYMQKKGISRDRLIVKGYGSSFPLASLSNGMTTHPLITRLNQRIEITLHGFETEPVIIHTEAIQVPENIQDSRGFRFNSLRHGLYYGVQLASISQILQNAGLETFSELYIEVNPDNGQYQYMAGMLTTIEEAIQLHTQVLLAGFSEPVIVPYLNGLRLSKAQCQSLADIYPDLQDYLAYLQKD